MVYKARLDNTHDVALKVVQPGPVDSKSLEQFYNEVSIPALTRWLGLVASKRDGCMSLPDAGGGKRRQD